MVFSPKYDVTQSFVVSSTVFKHIDAKFLQEVIISAEGSGYVLSAALARLSQQVPTAEEDRRAEYQLESELYRVREAIGEPELMDIKRFDDLAQFFTISLSVVFSQTGGQMVRDCIRNFSLTEAQNAKLFIFRMELAQLQQILTTRIQQLVEQLYAVHSQQYETKFSQQLLTTRGREVRKIQQGVVSESDSSFSRSQALARLGIPIEAATSESFQTNRESITDRDELREPEDYQPSLFSIDVEGELSRLTARSLNEDEYCTYQNGQYVLKKYTPPMMKTVQQNLTLNFGYIIHSFLAAGCRAIIIGPGQIANLVGRTLALLLPPSLRSSILYHKPRVLPQTTCSIKDSIEQQVRKMADNSWSLFDVLQEANVQIANDYRTIRPIDEFLFLTQRCACGKLRHYPQVLPGAQIQCVGGTAESVHISDVLALDRPALVIDLLAADCEDLAPVTNGMSSFSDGRLQQISLLAAGNRRMLAQVFSHYSKTAYSTQALVSQPLNLMNVALYASQQQRVKDYLLEVAAGMLRKPTNSGGIYGVQTDKMLMEFISLPDIQSANVVGDRALKQKIEERMRSDTAVFYILQFSQHEKGRIIPEVDTGDIREHFGVDNYEAALGQ